MEQHCSFWRGALVRLRAVDEGDVAALRAGGGEPDSASERADDLIRLPSSPAQDAVGLEQLGQPRDDDTFFWMVETLEHRHVGFINTLECDRRIGCFGYAVVIKRPFWGCGHAREALTLVLRYSFRKRRYQKVTAQVFAFNTRSLAFHERYGFVCEGRLRGTAYTNGQHYDTLYYGLTREEFDQIDPPPALPDGKPHLAPRA